jgi:hypothetical protein
LQKLPLITLAAMPDCTFSFPGNLTQAAIGRVACHLLSSSYLIPKFLGFRKESVKLRLRLENSPPHPYGTTE